jgi:WhiB family redox-sensing transcriptional regulator
MTARYIDLDRLDLDLWRRPGWTERAGCRGLDANFFHPERGEDAALAKRVCAACPVRDECLTFALWHFEKHGVWGGMSERERRPLRRRLIVAGRLEVPAGTVTNVLPVECGTANGYVAHRRRKEDACPACREAHSRAEAGRRVAALRYRDET